MAGIKQFDQQQVLERAMRCFWQRGYEATSMSALVAATGINRASLYATFGDKQRLFLAALDRYAECVGKPLSEALEDPNPRRAIERMFAAIIRRSSDPAWPRGCLNTNTALECPGGGEEISRKIAERFGIQESAIYRVVRRAQMEAILDPKLDARALARFFMGVAQGLNVVNKTLADPTTLNDIAKVALGVWDAAAIKPKPLSAGPSPS